MTCPRCRSGSCCLDPAGAYWCQLCGFVWFPSLEADGDAQTGFSLFAGESGDDCVFPDKSADVNTHEPDVPA